MNKYFYIIVDFLALQHHISATFLQYQKGTDSEKDDEILNWEYEPMYKDFHKFTRSKPTQLPTISDNSYTESDQEAKRTAHIDDALHEERAFPTSKKNFYPNDYDENNLPYRLYRNMKHPLDIENDVEGYRMKPNIKHNHYYSEEAYPTHSHNGDHNFRNELSKHKNKKFHDDYLQDNVEQNFDKEPLGYFAKKGRMRPSKKLIHEIKVIQIGNDMKDDDKAMDIPKSSAKAVASGNVEHESEGHLLQIRNLEDSFSAPSTSETEDNSLTSPTKKTLGFPNKDKSIHARFIEVFQEPSYKSENDRTDQKRGIASRTLNDPAGKNKDLAYLLNILADGIGHGKEGLKPANEETEINIVMRRTVRQKDFEAGKNSSIYHGSVTHWKEDSENQEKIPKLNGNNSSAIASEFISGDSTNESDELRKKRNKSSRQIDSMFLLGPKGWKTFSKVSKRSNTESPKRLKINATDKTEYKTFDYEEDLSEKIKDFIHHHSHNISDNGSLDIDSNDSKIIEVNEETLPETNLTSINKKEKVVHLEQKTYQSIGKPVAYKSPLSDVIESPTKTVSASTVSKKPPNKSEYSGTEIDEQISPELQLLVNALNLHKVKGTSPSNILATDNKITTNGKTAILSTAQTLQMNQTFSAETTVSPKNGLEWELSKLGNFILQSIEYGSQTTQKPILKTEAKGNSLNIPLKSNISKYKSSQKPKTPPIKAKPIKAKKKSRLRTFPKLKSKMILRTTKLTSTLPSRMTKRSYLKKTKHRKLVPVKKLPYIAPLISLKRKVGRVTSSIPKLSTGCEYCSKEIKIIDASVEILETSSDLPMDSNNTFKVFLENDVELFTAPVKNTPLETDNNEMEIYTIAPKIFKLTTEDFFRKADPVFNKVFERNPQSLSINHLQAPRKADINSQSLSEIGSPAKQGQNIFPAELYISTVTDESNPESDQSTEESVQYNKRDFKFRKSKLVKVATTKYPKKLRNFAETGKITVNELISRNIILTDLLSVLNKKDEIKKDFGGRTSQINRLQIFDFSGKHAILAAFILALGIVLIFLLFSAILYWMGYRRGIGTEIKKDYMSMGRRNTEQETIENLLPYDQRKATIVDKGQVFYTNNDNESANLTSLKHLVTKAAESVNGQEPVKEDVKLLTKRVMSDNNGLKPYKDIIPSKWNSSKCLYPQSSRNNPKPDSFDPKLNSVSNIGSDNEDSEFFDKNNRAILEILSDEGSGQNSTMLNLNKNSSRKPRFFK